MSEPSGCCLVNFIREEKKQHKHKFFGPDFPRTFLTLTPGCPGVKKFLPTTGAAGKRTFWCGRPRFSARTSMTRRVVEKLCAKKVCGDFLVPIKAMKYICDLAMSYIWRSVARSLRLRFLGSSRSPPIHMIHTDLYELHLSHLCGILYAMYRGQGSLERSRHMVLLLATVYGRARCPVCCR